MGRFAPLQCPTRPEAKQHPLPNVRMYGGKVSSRPLPLVLAIAHAIERRHATRTDSEIESLSEMPADGISLPPKGTSAHPAGAARRLGYINGAIGRKGS